MMSTATARFWAKVEVREDAACWPWRGATDPRGYGNFWLITSGPGRPGRCLKAHRALFILLVGEAKLGPGLVVGHACDHPSCCNPLHLFVATQAINLDDMFRKGRHRARRGERHARAKLTEALVREMRARNKAGEKCAALARECGVASSTLSLALRGETWRHVA